MSVAIYKLDRGITLWRWLCANHLAKAKALGWTVMETKPAPHGGLSCDDCPRAA